MLCILMVEFLYFVVMNFLHNVTKSLEFAEM